MIEEDVRMVIESFNRFRRPFAQARLLDTRDGKAVVEFLGNPSEMENYIGYFKDDLESITGSVGIESIERNGTCRATFSVGRKALQEDPLEKALRILDKYNEGVTPIKFGVED